jgi:hypothetical protein
MFDLRSLSRYRFAGKSEQAVREEWIRPLLAHLGYGIETLHEVRYEERLQLAAPFRRLGRERVEVDYRPTVWGHGLWIIEAKAHGRDEWDEAISQAWMYATHPEVDVPFMAVTDGSRIAVYDVNQPDWDDPVVDISSGQLVKDFPELAAVLGAANVTRKVRERRMRHLGLAMRAELSLATLAGYVREVQALADTARPAVIENQRSVLRDQSERERLARQEAVSAHGLFAVGVWANQPLAINFESASLALAHLRGLPPERRQPELSRLAEAAVVRSGPHPSSTPRMFWMLRATALKIYLQMRDDPACGDHAEELARVAIRDHLLDFPDDPVSRAAHRLERVLPVFLLRSLLAPNAPDLSRFAREVQSTWSDETRLRVGMSGDLVLTDMVTQAARRIWDVLEWHAPALNAAAEALEDAIPRLDYAEGGARGPAGDPYLENFLKVDYLVMTTLSLIESEDAVTLVDPSVLPVLEQLSSTHDDAVHPRFLQEPAARLVAELRDGR